MVEGYLTTVDHGKIKSWAEKNKGQPEIIDHPGAGADKRGLRINFPEENNEEYLGESKKRYKVSWEVFFQYFDDQGLAFMFEENPKTEDLSNAYRFIKKDNLEV